MRFKQFVARSSTYWWDYPSHPTTGGSSTPPGLRFLLGFLPLMALLCVQIAFDLVAWIAGSVGCGLASMVTRLSGWMTR